MIKFQKKVVLVYTFIYSLHYPITDWIWFITFSVGLFEKLSRNKILKKKKCILLLEILPSVLCYRCVTVLCCFNHSYNLPACSFNCCLLRYIFLLLNVWYDHFYISLLFFLCRLVAMSVIYLKTSEMAIICCRYLKYSRAKFW